LFYGNPPRCDIGAQIICQGIGAIFRFWAPATLWKALKACGNTPPGGQEQLFFYLLRIRYRKPDPDPVTSGSQIKLTNRTTARRIQNCHMWISTREKEVKNNNKNRKLLHLDLTQERRKEQKKEHIDVTYASHLVKIGLKKPKIVEVSLSCYTSHSRKI
jgi:hypothetical protein